MASTPQLVSMLNFKSLSSRLTDTEFNCFVSKLCATLGREGILRLLCSAYMTTTSSSQSDTLTIMTSMVSDILQKRSPSTAPETTMKLIDMPSPLVGEIGAFLHQKTYAAFSRTSRKIFVSCHSPNTLRGMDLTKVADYTVIRLERFPHLNRLELNLKHISQFNDKNGQRFYGNKQLRSLLIYGNGSTSSDMNQGSSWRECTI